MKYCVTICLVFSLVSLLVSCKTQNLFESGKAEKGDTTYSKPMGYTIRPNDKLTISIWNHDDLSVGSLFGVYNSNEVYGKWIMVDANDSVALPQVGKVKLGGLTISDAEKKLFAVYAKFIVNPVIVVKVQNSEVTILGEVIRPGCYVLEKENYNIVQIIGKAGGLDFYANKKKIQLIRGVGRDAKKYEYDLTDMENFKNYDLTVVPGDIIYIPTRNGKMLDKKAPAILPVASVITAIIVILKFFGQ